MAYVALCGLCRGNGYITVVVEGKEEIKQCWLCESKGENFKELLRLISLFMKLILKKNEISCSAYSSL